MDLIWNPVSADENQVFLSSFNLHNYPNPFNPETTISFSLTAEDASLRQGYTGQAENAEIGIYNLKGQKIKTFPVILSAVEGQSSIIWNGRDSNGNPMSSGVFFYNLKVNGKTISIKKCLLLK